MFWLIWRETDWSGRVTCALQTESNERETDAVTSGDKATKTASMNSVEWIIHAVHMFYRGCFVTLSPQVYNVSTAKCCNYWPVPDCLDFIWHDILHMYNWSPLIKISSGKTSGRNVTLAIFMVGN